jgi:hypothetical protein
MDALRRNHTWDVVDRPTDRKITTRIWKDQNMPLPTTIQMDDDIL